MPKEQTQVILLHGLLRSPRSMKYLAKHLEQEGYQVFNVGYASRSAAIMPLAEQVIPSALHRCSRDEPIHFVTHSMGGILLRAYLSRHTVSNLGRVVMLGPPNQGSEIINKLGDLPLFKCLVGPAGMQLGVGDTGVPATLGAAEFEVGVIAGDRSFDLISSALLPRKNDGKVTLSSTRLAGMSDHVVMPTGHVSMLSSSKVKKAVVQFLRHGRFSEA